MPVLEARGKLKSEWLGSEHSAAMESFSNFVVVLESQDKYGAVEGLNRRPFIGKENSKAIRPGPQNALKSMSSLSEVLGRKGEYKITEKTNQRALVGYRNTQGPQHPDTLRNMSD